MPASSCHFRRVLTDGQGGCWRRRGALRGPRGGCIVSFYRSKERCRRACTCGVEARAARVCVRRGTSGNERSGGSSACSVQSTNHPRSVLAQSRALKRTPPHTTPAHNNTSSLTFRTARRRCPRGIVIYCRAVSLWLSRLAPAPLDEAPCCRRRAVRHHLHFYLRLRDSHGLDSSSPQPQHSGYIITSKNMANQAVCESSLHH